LKHTASVIAKPIKHSQLQEQIIEHLNNRYKKILETENKSEPDDTKTVVQLNILLAEDNPVNQKVTKRILQKLGYEIDIAANGKEVLSAVNIKNYDLILMDINMPELNGYETSKIIRKELSKENQPVIIAMTAGTLQENEKEFNVSGMNDFIEKPINYNQMIKKVFLLIVKESHQ
jgi:CheY-like chemotaxis protein